MRSLILNGICTGSGDARASYRPAPNEWHLVSSPLVNASISEYIDKSWTIKTDGDLYALDVYNNANACGSKYEYYTDGSANGRNFIP